MTKEEAARIVRAVCETLPESLGIDDADMRYLISVEFADDVLEVNSGGVLMGDVGPEVAAMMAMNAMRVLCKEVGIEVGMIDLESLAEAIATEDFAKPKRVGARPSANRRPRKRRGR